MNKKKKEPWRIVVAIISFAFIIYMWVEKDIVEIYTTMPAEQVLPVIVITIMVTLFKIGVFTGGIFLLKWVVNKIRK